MAKRSVLQEHARRRAAERDAEDSIDPSMYENGFDPYRGQRRARLPKPETQKKDESRLMREYYRNREDQLLAQLEKTGAKGKAQAAEFRELRAQRAARDARAQLKALNEQTKILKSMQEQQLEARKKDEQEQERRHKEQMKALKDGQRQSATQPESKKGIVDRLIEKSMERFSKWVNKRIDPVKDKTVDAIKRLGETLKERVPSAVKQRGRQAVEYAKQKLQREPHSNRAAPRESLRDRIKRGFTPRAPGPEGAPSRGLLGDWMARRGGVAGLGNLARTAAPVIAGGYAAYEGAKNIGTVFDGTQSTGDRIKAGAHVLTSGAGGVIGGMLGGVQGAAYGSAAGEAVASGADWLGEKLANTKFGDYLGAGIAHVLSPFSDEAAEAVKSTREANEANAKQIVESQRAAKDNLAARGEQDAEYLRKKQQADASNVKEMKATIDPLVESTSTFADRVRDYTNAAENAASTVWGGLKSGARAVVGGFQNAGSAIAEGYKKDGVMGAIRSVGGAAKEVGAGVVKGRDALSSSIADAALGVQYDLNKGSRDPLKLALGFSGKNTVKGLNDSQTRALAGNTMATESAGRIDVVNKYGYSGQYQMGADALADHGVIDKDKLAAAKAESKAAGRNWYADGDHKAFMSNENNWLNKGGRQAFLNDKQMQDDLFVKYTNKNIEGGLKSGALTGTSTPEQIAAYAKAAHLKGIGGANDLVLKGKSSTDANGTSAAKYAADAKAAVVDLASQVDQVKAKTDKTEQLAKSDTPSKVKNEPVMGTVTKDDSVTMRSASTLGSTPMQSRPPEQSPQPSLQQQRAEIAQSIAPTPTSSVAPMTPVAREVVAKAQPQPLLRQGVPTESQSQAIQVAAATAPAPQAAKPTASGTPVAQQSGQTGMPTLDDMPMRINDVGLILLNVGHV